MKHACEMGPRLPQEQQRCGGNAGANVTAADASKEPDDRRRPRSVGEAWGGWRARHAGAIRSVLAMLGGSSAATAIAAIGGVLAARFVEPELAGSFRVYTIPLMYVQFLHLGTFDGLTRQIPLYVGRDRRDIAEVLASAAGAWNVRVSAVVSVGFLACAAWSLIRADFSGALGWSSQALVCWAAFYGGYLAATYRTIDQFVGLARIQTVQSVLSFALVFSLPVLRFSGLCLRAAAPSVIGVWLYHRMRPLRIPLKLEKHALLDVMRIGIPFCFWGSIYTSFWAALESTLMLALGGVYGLGLFSVALVVREAASILPLAIHQVLTPRVVEAYGRKGALKAAHVEMLKLVVPLLVLAIGGVIALSYALDFLVPLLIPRYVDGLGLMKLALWSAVVRVIELPLSSLFASGRSWVYGRGILAGVTVFPIATYLLAPVIGGMMAVAAGALLGKLVRAGVGHWDMMLITRREGR